MLVRDFGNNWIQTIPLSSEFFSSNYFQIGQHVVLLHKQMISSFCQLFDSLQILSRSQGVLRTILIGPVEKLDI